jgi:hypothetical protein
MMAELPDVVARGPNDVQGDKAMARWDLVDSELSVPIFRIRVIVAWVLRRKLALN